MRARMVAVVAAVAVALPMAGLGAAETEPHIVDGCGDAADMVRVRDTVVVPVPDEERAAGFDIDTVWFEDLYDGEDHVGVSVHMQLCGDVPEVELPGSHWSVRWQVDEDCSAVLSVHDDIHVPDPTLGVVRGVGLSAQCQEHDPTPVIGGWYGRTVWIEPLADGVVSIDGNRITWTLDASIVPAERAERVAFLAAGSTWGAPSAETRDGRWLTGASAGVRATGPGALDITADGRDFTVGE